MDERTSLDKPTQQQSELLVISLTTLAWVVGVVGTLASAGAISQAALRRKLDLETVLLAAAWLLAGLVTAVVLWTLAWIVRTLAEPDADQANS